MTRRTLCVLAATALTCGTIRAAAAHATLERASPPAGSTVPQAPDEIRLWFSEALEPRFSGAVLAGATGNPIARGDVVAGMPTQIVIRAQGLGPGVYKVTWSVVSVDTHKTEGSFSFEVKR
jgi:copper resistance protein C